MVTLAVPKVFTGLERRKTLTAAPFRIPLIIRRMRSCSKLPNCATPRYCQLEHYTQKNSSCQQFNQNNKGSRNISFRNLDFLLFARCPEVAFSVIKVTKRALYAFTAFIYKHGYLRAEVCHKCVLGIAF